MKLLVIGFVAFCCINLSLCISKEEGIEMAKTLLTECKNEENGTDEDYKTLLAMEVKENFIKNIEIKK